MTSPQSKHYLILLAHGSTDPRWREPFETLLKRLHTEQSDSVEKTFLAYMEMAEPTLNSVLANLTQSPLEAGSKIKILPLFMASGGHLRHDVPNQVAELNQRYPHLNFELLPPIGEHPLIQDTLLTICKSGL